MRFEIFDRGRKWICATAVGYRTWNCKMIENDLERYRLGLKNAATPAFARRD
jgi:hypothetical protein